MKSLLQTLPEAKTVELWGASVRTNLAALVEYAEDWKKADLSGNPKKGTSDPVLIPALFDAYANVEVHDLRVFRGSVMAYERKLSVWMTPGPGFGIVPNGTKTRTSLGLKRCKLYKNRLHEDPKKVILPVLEARFHTHACPVRLAIDVMET